MKQYPVVDLTGDNYINPVGVPYGDGSGLHQRAIGAITSISIHHDASFRPHDYDSAERYRNEAAQHYQRLGPGLQYHWKIDNVGTIFKLRPMTTWLYVVGSAENVSTAAICLDGCFEPNVPGVPLQDPTGEQGEALFQLIYELSTQHPEFPATWPDVRPHSDFSSTACCGANLRNRIYPITDEQTARAQLLNRWSYDWPELQPNPAPAPTPAPQPAPQPTPPSVEVNYRVFKGGKQIGAYKLDTNAWNKYKSENADLIKDGNGADVTERLRLKFDPAPPAPTPAPNNDWIKIALEEIKRLIQAIIDKLGTK